MPAPIVLAAVLRLRVRPRACLQTGARSHVQVIDALCLHPFAKADREIQDTVCVQTELSPKQYKLEVEILPGERWQHIGRVESAKAKRNHSHLCERFHLRWE